MILWCAYCRQFLREEKPFDDYRISHAVCPACEPKVLTFTDSDQSRLEGIIEFFLHLEEVSLSGSRAEVPQILKESQSLGIRPVDLMMGLLQPLLSKIGDLWAAKEITVDTEHRFSALVGDLLAHVRNSSKREAGPAAPELILVNAEGNYHTLGLQMAEVYLAAQGIPTLTVIPGLPTNEILQLVRLHKPKAIGFSVALPNQMEQVWTVARHFKQARHAPRHILVGGPAVRLGLGLEPTLGIEACYDLAEVRPRLSRSHEA